MKTMTLTVLMTLALAGSAFAQSFSDMTASEQRATVVHHLNNGSAQSQQVTFNK